MLNFKITKDYKPDENDGKIRGIRIDVIPSVLLILLIFSLPLFFLPSGVATLLSSKMFLVGVFVLISVFIVALLKLKEQKISLPYNLVSLSLFIIPAVTLLAGIFSKNLTVSFIGRDFGIDTVVSTIIMFLLLLVVSIEFQEKRKIAYAYSVIVLSFLFIFIAQVLYFLIPDIMPSLGFFTSNVSTTVGKWNDLAIFSVLISIISLTTIQTIRLEKVAKIILYIAFIASLVTIIVVNFSIAWYSLAIFTLILFVYIIVVKNKGSVNIIPFTPLAVFLISFLFIIAGNNIGGTINNLLNINHFEVRPSWSSTVDVIKGTVLSRPTLGVGPGLFETEWLIHKPVSVNNSDFWNVDFRYGVGYIPSFVVTTGIIGLISWAFFFVMYLFLGFKAIFRKTDNIISHYFLLTSFCSSMFMWVMMILYIPSSALIALTFILTGMFMATAYREGLLKTKTIVTENDPKSGFIYITVLILLMIGTIIIFYNITNKFVAETYFRSAVIDLNVKGDAQLAEVKIIQALQLNETDLYQRSLGEIGSIRISEILRDTNTPQDLLIDQFRSVLSSTVANYQAAIDFDSLNYNNYRDLGNLYQALVSLNIAGSYDQAKNMYEEARKLNPKSPELTLSLARLELSNGNNDKAREYISESLSLKQNYTDAIFLLSQIDVSEGNIERAIQTVEAGTIIKPNDPIVFFQLGLLRYNNNQFVGAVSAFERAVILNPFFQNAKYFLGLSYSRVGRDEDAIAQFRDLKALNQNNQEIDLILGNLEDGLNPFAGAEPPIDSTPEDREEPPLEDDVQDESVTNTSGVEE